MKFVKCINTAQLGWLPSAVGELTEGKIYEVTNEGHNGLRVVNDIGIDFGYVAERFEVLPSEETLKQLKVKYDDVVAKKDALDGVLTSLSKEISKISNEIFLAKKVTVGSRWKDTKTGDEYIVARSAGDYLLVCLLDGGCWQYPKEDINDIFGQSRDRFVKLG